MKGHFKRGDVVVRFDPRTNTPYEKLVVSSVNHQGVWTHNKHWTKTGLRAGEMPGPYRARIRHMTAEDEKYLERVRLVTILTNYDWMKLSDDRLTQVLLCLPSEASSDNKEQDR